VEKADHGKRLGGKEGGRKKSKVDRTPCDDFSIRQETKKLSGAKRKRRGARGETGEEVTHLQLLRRGLAFCKVLKI
jgi:hypothetical protein